MIENTFRTKDLSLSAFLYASDKKLIGLEEDNGKYWFIFADKEHCEELVNSYWRKEATVVAKDYADSIQSLKTLIFNKER